VVGLFNYIRQVAPTAQEPGVLLIETVSKYLLRSRPTVRRAFSSATIRQSVCLSACSMPLALYI